MKEISEAARKPQVDLDLSHSLRPFDDKFKISQASLLDGLSIHQTINAPQKVEATKVLSVSCIVPPLVQTINLPIYFPSN